MQNMLVVVAVLAAVALLYIGYRVAELRANLKFEQWKNAYARQIRREAISGSQAAVAGRVFERVAPYLPGFGYNPRDIRFLGDPVDFVIFDGLSEGNLRNVVFVEVKTGDGELHSNERKVKTAIRDRCVEWSLYRIAGGQPDRRDAERGSVRNTADETDAGIQSPAARGAAFIERGRF